MLLSVGTPNEGAAVRMNLWYSPCFGGVLRLFQVAGREGKDEQPSWLELLAPQLQECPQVQHGMLLQHCMLLRQHLLQPAWGRYSKFTDSCRPSDSCCKGSSRHSALVHASPNATPDAAGVAATKIRNF